MWLPEDTTIHVMKKNKNIDGLIKLINEKEGDAQIKASNALSDIIDNEDVQILIKYLNNSNREIKCNLIRSFSFINNEVLLKNLVQYLEDEDELIRKETENSLENTEVGQNILKIKKEKQKEIFGIFLSKFVNNFLRDLLKKDTKLSKGPTYTEIFDISLDPHLNSVLEKIDTKNKKINFLKNLAKFYPFFSCNKLSNFLLEGLQDEDWKIRKFSVMNLGKMGCLDSLEQVTYLLYDPVRKVQLAAEIAIKRLENRSEISENKVSKNFEDYIAIDKRKFSDIPTLKILEDFNLISNNNFLSFLNKLKSKKEDKELRDEVLNILNIYKNVKSQSFEKNILDLKSKIKEKDLDGAINSLKSLEKNWDSLLSLEENSQKKESMFRNLFEDLKDEDWELRRFCVKILSMVEFEKELEYFLNDPERKVQLGAEIALNRIKNKELRKRYTPEPKVPQKVHNKKRRIHKPLNQHSIPKQREKDLNQFTGQEFEEFLKELFGKMGYEVEKTPISGDYGTDLILYDKLKQKTLVQAKRHNNKINIKAIQEIVASIKHYKAHSGIVVTNSVFTKPAKKLAASNNILLLDGNKLKELIKEFSADNY